MSINLYTLQGNQYAGYLFPYSNGSQTNTFSLKSQAHKPQEPWGLWQKGMELLFGRQRARRHMEATNEHI